MSRFCVPSSWSRDAPKSFAATSPQPFPSPPVHSPHRSRDESKEDGHFTFRLKSIMATMTTVRSTPSLTIAPSQNTAPVYEFRCLYSHDLRKKKKLWHDGSLRYHTFNKRVMVYDESKNYIGDSHWREEEELQEGTELKLDKGVLVDIGERLGQTETDLAPLLEKRRPENGSSPVRAPLRPISLSSTLRTNLGHSQTRPKSLSAVLGLSQGPIGRARLPVQSPYEQLHRMTGTISHYEEPPAKRQRVSQGKGIAESNRNSGLGEKQVSKGAPSAPIAPKRNRLQPLERRQDPPPKDVIDISSEDDTPALPSSLLLATPKGIGIPKRATSSVVAKVVSPKPSMRPPRQQPRSAPALVKETVIPNQRISNSPAVSSVVSCYGSSATSSNNKLRLAVHKPRKKLVYRELLLSSKEPNAQHKASSSKNTSSAGPDRKCIALHSRIRIPSPTQVPELIDAVNDDNNSSSATVTMSAPPGDGSKEPDIEKNLADLFAQSSSPLFMPRSPGREASQVSEQPSPSGFLPPSPSPFALPAAKPSPKKTTAQTNGTAAPVDLTTNTAQSAPLSKLTILDQQLLMPPPKTAVPASVILPTSRKQRLFRRVVSENDSTAYTRPRETEAAPAIPTNPHVASPSTRQSTIQKPFKSPTKLTKSLSDGAVKPKGKQPSMAADVPIEAGVEQDSGPWSKIESFLLFDWHPPGRERLMLDGYEQDSLGKTVMKRAFLSDQIDAL